MSSDTTSGTTVMRIAFTQSVPMGSTKLTGGEERRRRVQARMTSPRDDAENERNENTCGEGTWEPARRVAFRE